MPSLVRRVVIAAILGAMAGALCLAAAYSFQPGLTFEMDAPLPPFITGIYSGERDALVTFAWTSGRVDADIAGLDRRAPWSCTLRFRGARAEGTEQPTVDVLVDGDRAISVRATNEYHEVGISIPAAVTSGLTIAINIAPTFTPGTADTRVLGVQVDRFACRRSAEFIRPPARAWWRASLSAAVFSAALALAGLSMGGAVLAGLAVAAGQAAVMASAGGVYGSFPVIVFWLAVGVSASSAVLARVMDALRRQTFSSAARFVFGVSAVALFLKLIALMHPAKPVIDAVFHAHRLDAVMAGGYFFTQPMPDGVRFPYAIGLYVFAAPWAWLTGDPAGHVAVIRIVTAATDVVAGALLYPVVVSAWGDRRAAALAVLAFQLMPLSLVVLGNANLTNVFGQSVALVTMAAAATWTLSPRRVGQLLAFTVIVAWGLCSHISTASTLSATLAVLVLLYYWRGDSARRGTARAIVVATAAALVLAWLAYYRHFMEVYRMAFTRMFAERAAGDPAVDAVKGYMSVPERATDLVTQLVGQAGWPLFVLAGIGAWTLWRRRTRDRLTCALLAWAAVWALFSAFTVFSRVEPAYVRYTAEFLGRINLATLPLLAILAGRGAAAGWDAATPSGARPALQLIACVLIASAMVMAVRGWMEWL